MDEIVDPDIRRSAITSHVIGVPELAILLSHVPPEAPVEAYRAAVVGDNVLGLKTESGRIWRFKTLRRLYLLRPDSVLFRALRDLWEIQPESRPLLAGLCALATDTVFRATAEVIVNSNVAEELAARDFVDAVEARYPGAYATGTMRKVAGNAVNSWEQLGHLSRNGQQKRIRARAKCLPGDIAYALLLGHLQGARGEGLFDTLWAKVLDVPRSHMPGLAFAASQRGMLEFRSAGGVMEVGFRQLLRPVGGQLL